MQMNKMVIALVVVLFGASLCEAGKGCRGGRGRRQMSSVNACSTCQQSNGFVQSVGRVMVAPVQFAGAVVTAPVRVFSGCSNGQCSR